MGTTECTDFLRDPSYDGKRYEVSLPWKLLCWIQNDKHWKQYVKHHVHEIRQMTAKKDWRYCPGVQNAADLPSRGLTGNKMVDNSMWWCSPQFLQLPEEEWLQEQATIDTNEAALSEVVKNPLNVIHGASIL